MSDISYMQNNNGVVTMYCEQLPSKGFIDAIKVRDICSIRIKTREEKKAIGMGPDVDVIYATGEKQTITREQAAKSFIHCNGKKINIGYLRSGTKYFVVRNANNENYKIIQIPSNCVGNLRGSKVNSGYYIVCKANQDGTPNVDTMYAVSPKMFRKMFKIPMQTIIKRHMGKPSNKKFGLFDQNRRDALHGRRQVSPLQQSMRNQQSIAMPRNINLGTGVASRPSSPVNQFRQRSAVNNMQQAGRMRPAQPVQQVQQETNNLQENKYKYTVTHRIVSMTNNALIGFVVKEISTNVSKQLQTRQVYQLCENKLIDNVMLVQRGNGVKFLKGNNMRLESLPQVIA